MTNEEIVETYIVKNDKVINAFDKLTNGSERWKDDLWQEILIIFLEMDNEKLNGIFESKKGDEGIRAYFVRIVQLQLHSSTSPFYTKYRSDWVKNNYIGDNDYLNSLYEEHHGEELPEIIEEDPDTEFMATYNKIMNELPWYEENMWKLYLETGAKRGSYQTMHQMTQIPVFSIGKTIREVRRYIGEHIKYRMNKHIGGTNDN